MQIPAKRNLMKSKVLIISLFLVISCRDYGQVRFAQYQEAEGNRVILGHFENRDMRFTPFTARNFQDMLRFELLLRGYSAGFLEREDWLRLEDGQETHSVPGEIEAADSDSYDLSVLPPSLGDVAGQISPRADARRTAEPRRLGRVEIMDTLADLEADYFIQGAIGRGETGTILEIEEQSLVFVEVYGVDGNIVGVLNHRVRKANLADVDYLKVVCERIAEGLRF